MHAKGSILPSGNKGRALALLAAEPNGLTSRDIAERLGVDFQQSCNFMGELSRMGVIVGVRDGQGRANQRRIWCMPDRADAIKARTQKAPVKSQNWQKSGLGKTPYREQRAANLESAPKVVCPGYEDKRFVVERPEHPCFSAMRPGEYLGSGSAIERAYASRGK